MLEYSYIFREGTQIQIMTIYI